MHLNTNYENLEQSYLFSTVAKKVNEFISKNPDKKVIRLGIGDVTLPLCKVVVDALHKAVDEMGVQVTLEVMGRSRVMIFCVKRFRNIISHIMWNLIWMKYLSLMVPKVI